jgi:hypothetical protein
MGQTVIAVLSIAATATTVAAQSGVVRYGGEPPWGLEKPIHISGTIHRGEIFKWAIGRGLYFRLEPTDYGWEIEVADEEGIDFSDCIEIACHGGASWRRSSTSPITPAEHRAWLRAQRVRPVLDTDGSGGAC